MTEPHAEYRHRPAPDPAVVAMVGAALDQWAAEAAAGAAAPVDTDARRAWRFSGRWWSLPLPARRPRPWRG